MIAGDNVETTKRQVSCGQFVLFYKFLSKIRIFDNNNESWCSFEDCVSGTEDMKITVTQEQNNIHKKL